MVHIVTGGGARPKPGSAGWGALISQNGEFMYNWGHWDMASNNAMELLAVTEALQIIPDQMHVCIMTDSAYVKNGITQCIGNWTRNGWKNAGGARVANKSLWERLIAAVHRMRRVEWSWVKAHDGRLLNECADMLATKGVLGEQRTCPVETVRVVWEDTDASQYELRDGEETPVAGKDGDQYPVGQTYVLKAGPDAPDGFSMSSVPSHIGPDQEMEQRIENCLKETIELCERPESETAAEPVKLTWEQVESDSHPIPDCLDDDDDREPIPMPFFAPTHMPQPPPSYEWWTPAWESLNGMLGLGGVQPLIPVCPSQFKDLVDSDVFMVDDVMFQSKIDSDTGEPVDARTDPEFITVVAGCIHNNQYATLIKVGRKGAVWMI
jgi:ribonuclease HI